MISSTVPIAACIAAAARIGIVIFIIRLLVVFTLFNFFFVFLLCVFLLYIFLLYLFLITVLDRKSTR